VLGADCTKILTPNTHTSFRRRSGGLNEKKKKEKKKERKEKRKERKRNMGHLGMSSSC
jgi:hypothetical protein